MSYESVDQLQKALTENVFGYAKDSKKAAGRALGTIVEIITFYLLKSWGLSDSISIETRIPEFGNPDITHNVEYSLHPIFAKYVIEIPNDGRSLTAHRLLGELATQGEFSEFEKMNNTLLSGDGILRNACTIARNDDSYLVASIVARSDERFVVSVAQQSMIPFAIFECKRVGVEEGTKKGPQTIEKAKQGAYVARTVSSLQKVRLENGDLYGIIYRDDEVLYSAPYHELLDRVINSDDPHLLRNFILTTGVVSNHGNWFTAEDHNKELKVLAQSYDWLIFLTDEGITEFIEEVIFDPRPEYSSIRDAFLASYAPGKKKNQFTKVKMNVQADEQLLQYFASNASRAEKWFSIISPSTGSLEQMRREIHTLQTKDWRGILR
jgi:hypothetical protein